MISDGYSAEELAQALESIIKLNSYLVDNAASFALYTEKMTELIYKTQNIYSS